MPRRHGESGPRSVRLQSWLHHSFPGDVRHTAFPPGAVTAPSGAVAWRHVGKRFENQSREQLAPPLWKSPAAPQKAKQSVTVGPS